jgi:hypothetical protein
MIARIRGLRISLAAAEVIATEDKGSQFMGSPKRNALLKIR